MSDFEPTNEVEFEAFLSGQWQLGRKLSNPRLIDGVFIADEKTPEGVITYNLPLNDFLAVKDKAVVSGMGFYESTTTRNIQLVENSPYTLKYEASSSESADDWSPWTADLKKYLRMSNGILFANKTAPSLQISQEGAKSYEMSTEDVKAFISSGEEEGQLEEDERVPDRDFERHPEHKALEQDDPEPQMVANGLFSDGMKLGRLVNYFIDGPPHPGKIKYRKDAKGHEYFGCEKHEHPKLGDLRVSNPICL